jgi:integrase/recombinase XerD
VTAKPSRTIESFLEMLAAERGAAKNTLAAYANDLGQAEAFFARRGVQLPSADRPGLRAYLGALAGEGLGARTQARRLSALKQYFRFLISERRITADPTATLVGPRLPRALPKTLETEEITKLIEGAKRRPAPEGSRLVLFLELLYGTGLRVSELVSLPLAAIARDRSFLTVRGKGGKERNVPVTQAAAKALALYLPEREASLKGRNSRHLFPSRGAAGHLTRRRVAQLIDSLAREAGIDPARVSPHVLRHAFASHLLSGGADLRSIQAMLGHADIATTQIYTHLADDHLANLLHTAHPMSRRRGRSRVSGG